jgi:dTDP-4-dehydrorhamnose 3,5-epimerase
MKVERARLPRVLLLTPELFEDHRGTYVESYHRDQYRRIFREWVDAEIEFVQDDYSSSRRHVLRGIHGDAETWKLISCPHGEIHLVIVDCDGRSATFGTWESFRLTPKPPLQVLVPPRFGTAHVVLSDSAVFHYKQSTYYRPEELRQFSFRYDDPRFGIVWPVERPILSGRDERGG